MKDSNNQQQILNLASELINSDATMSEQHIDCNFIFRFEYGWKLRTNNIRTMLNQLARIGDSNKLIPADVSPKMWAYLEATKYLMVFPETITLDESFRIENPFRPFDEKHSDNYDKAISAAIGGSRAQLEDIWPRIQQEKDFVRHLQNTILLTGQQYQIVPLSFDLWGNFAFKDLEFSLVNLRNYFLFDSPIPKFIWDEITYIESKVNHGVLRWLRPDPVPNGSGNSLQTKQVRPLTRIRTWAVYFLTRRGGGQFTEPEAVDLWNHHFSDNLVPRNFRSERSALISGISKSK